MRMNKEDKGHAVSKRIKMLEEKRLRYFMENRTNEFRLKVIDPEKKHREKKINPRNIKDFEDEE